MVHGSIVATLIDSRMEYTLHTPKGRSTITCRLEVKYLHKIPLNKKILIIGRTNGKRGKILLTESEI